MRRCILLQLGENRRPFQVFTWSRMCRINRVPPRRAILFVDQLRYGNFGEIRVAQKFRPVEERAPESFRRQMDRLRRAIAGFCQIIAFQDI
jgi:hypothetical protein